MSITERINNDLKEAMKSGDKPRLMALRDIKSKLLLEMTKEGGDGGVDDTRSIAILNKLYKQRLESIDIYKSQQRQDLVDEEMTQAAVIKAYLPEMLEGEALEKIVRAIIAETGAASLSDLGKVMGAATKQLAGKAEGKAISDMVKKVLGGA
ncbi:MAG: GatB/YqeY domain-containing protein [Flavobacteriales bacterium]|nr:GatB/YqeY domain-containing protein [Flavobacteriales bacterium]